MPMCCTAAVSESIDKASVRFPPPLVFVLMILATVVLQRWVVPIELDIPLPIRTWFAGLIGVAGVAVLTLCLRRFKRSGQDPEPWKPTPEIISDGVYRYSRNPMYVGMALLQTALGIGLGNLWVIASVVLSLGLVYLIAVRHEEAYLASKFGDSYIRYRASVRRWF